MRLDARKGLILSSSEDTKISELRFTLGTTESVTLGHRDGVEDFPATQLFSATLVVSRNRKRIIVSSELAGTTGDVRI